MSSSSLFPFYEGFESIFLFWLVLCFSQLQWFLLFLPPKFLLISCRPIDSYSDICYLGTYEWFESMFLFWSIYVSISFWKGISVDMHAFLHKKRRENHRQVVFTQQDTIYSHAHLVLTNLLITSLLVLCVFPMISFVSASKNSFDFVSP